MAGAERDGLRTAGPRSVRQNTPPVPHRQPVACRDCPRRGRNDDVHPGEVRLRRDAVLSGRHVRHPPTQESRDARRDADIRPAGKASGGWRARADSAALAAAAGMWLASGAAVAGDLYLRGGIGLDRPGNTAFTDIDCSATAPAPLYGCGTGGDGARLRSRGRFGPAPAFEFGLGHAGGTSGQVPRNAATGSSRAALHAG